jgi:hypothetical protein
MHHRPPVNSNQGLRNTGIRRQQANGPEVVFPVNAIFTTIVHNRHAYDRKYTESRRLSTTAQPPYFTSTSGQRRSMPLKHQHPVTQRTRPQVLFPATASVTTLFHNRHAKCRNYTESRRLNKTDQPPYVPSTSGQQQSRPSKHRHPPTANKWTGSSISRQRNLHNTFP